MRIKWWGHAAFYIESKDGMGILTDPYDETLGYRPITDNTSLVTVSHDHFDHNAVHLLPGNPRVVDTLKGAEMGNVSIRGIKSYHDKEKGEKRGDNRIYIIEVDGIRICHAGDLGDDLSEEELAAMGEVHILMIPVGGFYTVDAQEAYNIASKIKPSIIIPMHYRTDAIDFPIAPVDDFKSLFNDEQVMEMGSADIEITSIPEEQKLVILDYVK